MILYIIGLIVSLGAGLWFIIKPPINRSWIYLFLSAGGAFLMTIIFTHILPELFEEIPATAGYVLLAGFLIQILLENYSKGIEHGHAHASGSTKILAISFIALCIHALIEGMPLSPSLFNQDTDFSRQLTVGIMLHKIPVAITLAMLMTKSDIKKRTAILLLTAFISCTLVGSMLQHFIGNAAGESATEFMFMSLGLTVGILLHVSTTILFESSDHHKLSPSRVAVIIVGITLGLLS